MKTKITLLIITFFLTSQFVSAISTNYVSKTGSHISPFTSWKTAATNIQAAVDQANGIYDRVFVSNGTYNLSSEIMVNGKSIILKSVNGPEVTIIDGQNSVRCVRFFDSTTTKSFQIEGFTLQNGYEDDGNGGGGLNSNNDTIVDDCYIIDNVSENSGGGILFSGGKSIVKNCTIARNSSDTWGGGVKLSNDDEIHNSKIFGNVAGNIYKGGGVSMATDSKIVNSLIYKNEAGWGGGADCSADSEIINCTIVSNTAERAGGVYLEHRMKLLNSIVYYNEATIDTDFPNWYTNNPDVEFKYSCINPIKNVSGDDKANISSAPDFENIDTLDFHLKPGAACENSGNNSYVIGDYDLDGNTRINGTVDMGCYEDIPEPFLFINCYLLFTIYYWKRKK